jgi:hypothetical protein
MCGEMWRVRSGSEAINGLYVEYSAPKTGNKQKKNFSRNNPKSRNRGAARRPEEKNEKHEIVGCGPNWWNEKWYVQTGLGRVP